MHGRPYGFDGDKMTTKSLATTAGILTLIFVPLLHAQAPSTPKNVVGTWTAYLEKSAEARAQKADLAVAALHQLSTLQRISPNPSEWPLGYEQALYRQAERMGLLSHLSGPAREYWDRGQWPVGINTASMAELTPSILAEIRVRNLPPELLAVPLVESGFNRFAESPKGARGLWQLMPQTAERYGLNVRRGSDERQDSKRSTAAALSYLLDLYAEWGDWQLALASYNAGEERVRRAVARAKSTSFLEVAKFLPQETRAYVPAVLAAAARLTPAAHSPVKRRGLEASDTPLKLTNSALNTESQRRNEQ